MAYAYLVLGIPAYQAYQHTRQKVPWEIYKYSKYIQYIYMIPIYVVRAYFFLYKKPGIKETLPNGMHDVKNKENF